MALLAKKPSFELPPVAVHDGVILFVDDATDVVSPFDKPDSPKEKVKITFRLDLLKSNDEPHEFGELYTNSLFEKAKLGQHLKGLFGTIPEDGFDLEKLEGTKLKIHVGHRESKNGGTFPQVIGLAPAFTATKADVRF